ncbi:hypothetical protein RRG08_049720 [Elysia crispata]|uniref:Uncharacterized protein n=1 Tax=Elysia crispata TaxID=231223 RepID=A0AAE1CUC7_9GAST|nr:hypothetical protein RRG08_049720 [Elysia crispata]
MKLPAGLNTSARPEAPGGTEEAGGINNLHSSLQCYSCTSAGQTLASLQIIMRDEFVDDSRSQVSSPINVDPEASLRAHKNRFSCLRTAKGDIAEFGHGKSSQSLSTACFSAKMSGISSRYHREDASLSYCAPKTLIYTYGTFCLDLSASVGHLLQQQQILHAALMGAIYNASWLPLHGPGLNETRTSPNGSARLIRDDGRKPWHAWFAVGFVFRDPRWSPRVSGRGSNCCDQTQQRSSWAVVPLDAGSHVTSQAQLSCVIGYLGSTVVRHIIRYTGSTVVRHIIRYTGSTVVRHNIRYTGSTVVRQNIRYTGSTVVRHNIRYTGATVVRHIIRYTGSTVVRHIIRYTGSTVVRHNIRYTGSTVVRHIIRYTGSTVVRHIIRYTGSTVVRHIIRYTGSTVVRHIIRYTGSTVVRHNIRYTGSTVVRHIIRYTGSTVVRHIIRYTGSTVVRHIIRYTGSTVVRHNIRYTDSTVVRHNIRYTGSTVVRHIIRYTGSTVVRHIIRYSAVIKIYMIPYY